MEQTNSRQKSNALPACFVGLVALGMWSLQTDDAPIVFNIRPSFYDYGWPLYYATCARGRFRFITFDAVSLLIDLLATIALIYATWNLATYLSGSNNKFSILDLFAFVAGTATLLFFQTGAIYQLLVAVGFGSDGFLAGTVNKPYGFIANTAIFIGTFSIGFVSTQEIARLLTKASDSPGNAG